MNEIVLKALVAVSSKTRASSSASFFKTGKGQYGEGDQFAGITVPNIRKIVKEYRSDHLSTFEDLNHFLESSIHEYRMMALIALVEMFKKDKMEEKRKEIFDFYLSPSTIKAINNWDLVDCSCYSIVGAHLLKKNEEDRKCLYTLAESDNIWERRIAIVSTLTFIKDNQFDDTLKISKLLLNDNEDLIHKACGWMLREVGKKKLSVLEKQFLRLHAAVMPRTMLRYSIEKLTAQKRAIYLSMKDRTKKKEES